MIIRLCRGAEGTACRERAHQTIVSRSVALGSREAYREIVGRETESRSRTSAAPQRTGRSSLITRRAKSNRATAH